MKHILITTIAAVVLVGCATTHQPEAPTAKAPDISIHDAAKEGNIEAVKQHLAAGTDVNTKDDAYGWLSSYPNWAKAFVSLDGFIICSMS